MDPATAAQILVIGFTSTDARDAAIARARNTQRNWQTINTEACISGYNIMLVQGAPANQAVREIGVTLIEHGAVRII
ncbi:MAG: hypothetical protein WBJ52_02465 [Methanoregulaceae archaeon]